MTPDDKIFLLALMGIVATWRYTVWKFRYLLLTDPELQAWVKRKNNSDGDKNR